MSDDHDEEMRGQAAFTFCLVLRWAIVILSLIAAGTALSALFWLNI